MKQPLYFALEPGPQEVEFVPCENGYTVVASHDSSVPSRRARDISSLSKAVQSVFNESRNRGGVFITAVRGGQMHRYYVRSWELFTLNVESIGAGINPEAIGMGFVL